MPPNRFWIGAGGCEDAAAVGQIDRGHSVGDRQKILQHERASADAAPLLLSGHSDQPSLAGLSRPKPNWTRQRNIMLVEMSWRRQTAAALTPGASDSITIARFSSSVKLRLSDRRSFASSAVGGRVKVISTGGGLAALLAPLLIGGRALG